MGTENIKARDWRGGLPNGVVELSKLKPEIVLVLQKARCSALEKLHPAQSGWVELDTAELQGFRGLRLLAHYKLDRISIVDSPYITHLATVCMDNDPAGFLDVSDFSGSHSAYTVPPEFLKEVP